MWCQLFYVRSTSHFFFGWGVDRQYIYFYVNCRLCNRLKTKKLRCLLMPNYKVSQEDSIEFPILHVVLISCVWENICLLTSLRTGSRWLCPRFGPLYGNQIALQESPFIYKKSISDSLIILITNLRAKIFTSIMLHLPPASYGEWTLASELEWPLKNWIIQNLFATIQTLYNTFLKKGKKLSYFLVLGGFVGVCWKAFLPSE